MYIGHIISVHGVSPDTDKTKEVKPVADPSFYMGGCNSIKNACEAREIF